MLQLTRANEIPWTGKDSNETVDEIVDYYYKTVVLKKYFGLLLVVQELVNT